MLVNISRNDNTAAAAMSMQMHDGPLMSSVNQDAMPTTKTPRSIHNQSHRNLIKRRKPPVSPTPLLLPSPLSPSCLDFNKQGLTALPTSIFRLPYLSTITSINLEFNLLGSLKGISQIPNLRILNVRQNLLDSLPEELIQCVHLRELHFGDNLLTCVKKKELPSSLEVVDFSNNHIEVMQDGCLEHLQLSFLDISHNRLRKLPLCLGFQDGLESLFISNNLWDPDMAALLKPLCVNAIQDLFDCDSSSSVETTNHQKEDIDTATDAMSSKRWSISSLLRRRSGVSTQQSPISPVSPKSPLSAPIKKRSTSFTPKRLNRSQSSDNISLRRMNSAPFRLWEWRRNSIEEKSHDNEPTTPVPEVKLSKRNSSLQSSLGKSPKTPTIPRRQSSFSHHAQFLQKLNQEVQVKRQKQGRAWNCIRRALVDIWEIKYGRTSRSPIAVTQPTPQTNEDEFDASSDCVTLNCDSTYVRSDPEESESDDVHSEEDGCYFSDDDRALSIAVERATICGSCEEDEEGEDGKADKVKDSQEDEKNVVLSEGNQDLREQGNEQTLAPTNREQEAMKDIQVETDLIQEDDAISFQSSAGLSYDVLEESGKPLPGVPDPAITKDVKRYNIILEILSTERRYVSQLRILNDVYYEPIVRKRILSPLQRSMLFGNCQTLLTIHIEFLRDLELSIFTNGVLEAQIGTVFNQYLKLWKLYRPYMENVASGMELEAQLSSESNGAKFAQHHHLPMSAFPPIPKRTKRRWKTFLKSLPRNSDQLQLDLKSFLILPVQRLPRYKLLLDSLIKHTTPEHGDYQSLCDAYKEVQIRIEECNEWRKKVDGQKNIESLYRHFILSRQLTLTRRGKRRLFDIGDHLVAITRPGRQLVDEFEFHVVVLVNPIGSKVKHLQFIKEAFGMDALCDEQQQPQLQTQATTQQQHYGTRIIDVGDSKLIRFMMKAKIILFSDIVCWFWTVPGNESNNNDGSNNEHPTSPISTSEESQYMRQSAKPQPNLKLVKAWDLIDDNLSTDIIAENDSWWWCSGDHWGLGMHVLQRTASLCMSPLKLGMMDSKMDMNDAVRPVGKSSMVRMADGKNMIVYLTGQRTECERLVGAIASLRMSRKSPS